MNRRRIGILTGGGDVAPLNAVIASAQKAAEDFNIELIGFIKGWLGVIEKRYIPISELNIDISIGGTILKSSRVNLEMVPNSVDKISENLKKLNVTGLIVIGGEDTLSNFFYFPEFPQVLISKTIDNDIGIIKSNNEKISSADIINYFTLGFPTAAKKISSFVSLKEGLRTTAYSHERIIVVESMGMHAGWLALASAMGHPDFIIIPEFHLDYDKLKNAIIEKYKRQNNLIIVVAEGSKWSNGSYLSADENEKDDFGHPRFKGSAEILAKKLKEDLENNFDTRNINAVNPSYLYRSGSPVELDLQWAKNLGYEAIKLFFDSLDKSVFLTIQKNGEKFSIDTYPLSNLNSIKEFHRFVDERFYNSEDYQITEEGKEYLLAIIDEIPLDKSYGLEIVNRK